MQTGLITVSFEPLQGVVVQKDWKATKRVFSLITFDRVCGYSVVFNGILISCSRVCLCNVVQLLPPLRMQIWLFPHSWQSRATTWHGSGPLWSFGFLCFLLSSNVCLNATCPARSKPLQCLPLIDSLIETSSNIGGCGCCRNVRTVSLDYQLPTTRMIKNKEN